LPIRRFRLPVTSAFGPLAAKSLRIRAVGMITFAPVARLAVC
jgi:hypothetical protein